MGHCRGTTFAARQGSRASRRTDRANRGGPPRRGSTHRAAGGVGRTSSPGTGRGRRARSERQAAAIDTGGIPSLRAAVRATGDPRRRRLAWPRVPPVRPARAAADVDLTRPDPPAASSSGRGRSRGHAVGGAGLVVIEALVGVLGPLVVGAVLVIEALFAVGTVLIAVVVVLVELVRFDGVAWSAPGLDIGMRR